MGQDRYHSQFFTLRLWWEDLGEGETAWRGQLLHVTSGQVRHFSDWNRLVPLVFSLLPPHSSSDQVNQPTNDGRDEREGLWKT